MTEIIQLHSILSPETKDVLVKTIRTLPPESVAVEIGSWVGESALAMAEQREIKHVYCIDTWLGNVELLPELKAIGDPLRQFLSNTERWREKITPIRMDGVNGLKLLKDQGIHPDVIFIDGNHEFEQAWADMHASSRFFPGIPIVLDDCGMTSVEQAARLVANQVGRRYERIGWAGKIV